MQLDEQSLKILSLLIKNSRISYRKIAKELNISVPTVSAKIDTLQKLQILKGYTTVVDFQKLKEYKDVFIITGMPERVEELLQHLRYSSNVKRIMIAEQNTIILIYLYKSLQELHKFLTLLSEHMVEYHRYSVITEEKYENEIILTEPISLDLHCYYCKGKIVGDPVIAKVRGDKKYFCCNTCRDAYLKKIARLTAL